MKLKIFTLRMDPSTGAFDDAAMEQFLDGKEVLSVSDNFFVHELSPTWALMVMYRDLERPGAPRREGLSPNWRAACADDERPLFDALRAWRNDKARAEGKPAYVLLTNRQIYEVARRRPASLTELRAIEGIGDAKLKEAGQELLAVIAASGGAARPDAPSASLNVEPIDAEP